MSPSLPLPDFDSLPPPPPPPRRIITGHDGNPAIASGTSAAYDPQAVVWIEDTLQTEPFTAGKGVSLWRSYGLPSDGNNENVDPATQTLEGFSNPHGTNLRITDFAPRGYAPMHRTSSIDYNTIISGHLVLILPPSSSPSPGANAPTVLSSPPKAATSAPAPAQFDLAPNERLVRPGDTVIQRGALHAWRNPSSTEWCRMVTTLVAARPVRRRRPGGKESGGEEGEDELDEVVF